MCSEILRKNLSNEVFEILLPLKLAVIWFFEFFWSYLEFYKFSIATVNVTEKLNHFFYFLGHCGNWRWQEMLQWGQDLCHGKIPLLWIIPLENVWVPYCNNVSKCAKIGFAFTQWTTSVHQTWRRSHCCPWQSWGHHPYCIFPT